jgi:hypothetical protein
MPTPGRFPDNLMRRSYGRARTVARLCAQPAQADDFELLRIALTTHQGRKGLSRSNIRRVDSGMSTMRKIR